jgi:hypothetical protein
MNYLTENGEPIKGGSPTEIVESLRDGSKFASQQSLNQFMQGFAERYKDYSGSVVRCDLPQYFVEDLLLCGYLRDVDV